MSGREGVTEILDSEDEPLSSSPVANSQAVFNDSVALANDAQVSLDKTQFVPSEAQAVQTVVPLRAAQNEGPDAEQSVNCMMENDASTIKARPTNAQSNDVTLQAIEAVKADSLVKSHSQLHGIGDAKCTIFTKLDPESIAQGDTTQQKPNYSIIEPIVQSTTHLPVQSKVQWLQQSITADSNEEKCAKNVENIADMPEEGERSTSLSHIQQVSLACTQPELRMCNIVEGDYTPKSSPEADSPLHKQTRDGSDLTTTFSPNTYPPSTVPHQAPSWALDVTPLEDKPFKNGGAALAGAVGMPTSAPDQSYDTLSNTMATEVASPQTSEGPGRSGKPMEVDSSELKDILEPVPATSVEAWHSSIRQRTVPLVDLVNTDHPLEKHTKSQIGVSSQQMLGTSVADDEATAPQVHLMTAQGSLEGNMLPHSSAAPTLPEAPTLLEGGSEVAPTHMEPSAEHAATQARFSSPKKPSTTQKQSSPRKASQETTLAELKAQRAALIASLAALPNVQELLTETETASTSEAFASEPTDVDIMAAANKLVKNHIKLLHEYNEIKDVGQGLMGLIADQRGVRIIEIQDEFGISSKD